LNGRRREQEADAARASFDLYRVPGIGMPGYRVAP